MRSKFTITLSLILVLISVFVISELVFANPDPTQEKQKLEAELAELEKMIAEYEADINKTEAEKKNLQNKIYILKKQIDKLDLQIYQSNLSITDLKGQIVDTEGSIEQTLVKIQDSREKLIAILQNVYEQDQKSLLEVLLAEAEFSDFFDDLVALDQLNEKSQDSLEEIKNLKLFLEDQKKSLDNEKSDLEHLVQITTLQKQESEKTKKQTNYYLQLTEAEYQEQVEKKEEVEAKAAEIRARIFELVGIPEAPTFGEALEIAKSIEKITGVRPAFLLAILTQESNIGKNVGQCYLKNTDTGAGVYIKTGGYVAKVMKPTRDVQPFLKITKELGRDPFETPVSCPMSYGYGGAMGPAQFIPSTWEIYRGELKQLTGSPADPWNIKDAFLAAALYVADYGAKQQTYNGEWKAAMIYFSGTSSRTAYNGYGFYGDSVMKITSQYEKDIKEVESAG